ncbi:MFS transporter [Myxococcota bacterium]|nr:MFS transporter [Myxococcota bacterium]
MRQTLFTRDFNLLLVGHFLQALGYASMLMLPLYLQGISASRASIGEVMATAAIGGLLFRPLAGWALDAWGRREVLMVATLFLSVGMQLIYFVHAVGPLIFIARFLIGVGAGALMTGYFTAAADTLTAQRRTEGLAIFGISGMLPMALNPLYAWMGLRPADLRVFFPIIGLIVLSSLLAVYHIGPRRQRGAARRRSKAPQAPPRQATASASHRALLREPLWPVWFATLCFGGGVAVFMAFTTAAAERVGGGEPTLLWLTYAASAIGIRVLAGKLPDRWGPSNFIAPALGAYALAFLLAASGWSFPLAGALAGFGHGYCFPVLTGQVVNRSPDEIRGAAMAGFTALWDLSALTLPPLFGRVADQHDDGVMFAAAALSALLGLTSWAWMEHRWAPSAGVEKIDGAATPSG